MDADTDMHISRRTLVRGGTATGLAAAMAFITTRIQVAACARNNGSETMIEKETMMAAMAATTATTMNVVLVHGAWADASSWSRVIPLLQQAGYSVSAVQIALNSLADDVTVTRRVLDAIPGPVTLVGHSYGGAVITGAGTAPNVKSLVYIAAFAPDEGESLGELATRFAPLESVKHYRPDAAGYLSVDPQTFPQDFAADVDLEQAQVMAITQRPVAAAIFGTKTGTPAWRTLPTFYQVSENDEMIAPDLERFFAARMKATTISLPSSHAAMVSHPAEIAQLIFAATKVGAAA